MQAHNSPKGYILITSEIEYAIEELENELQAFRKVVFFEENFKIEHAKLVTKEAYISESETKYIIIAASEFTAVAQNSLLKLLEEPPTNIEFIIISANKSNLLPTVRSRMPVMTKNKTHLHRNLSINLARLDYKEVFSFLKEHSRVTKNEAKSLVEALFVKATLSQQLILSQDQLDNFDMAYRLLDLNARPQSVLAMILMSFAGER